jgi:hypothetical protein
MTMTKNPAVELDRVYTKDSEHQQLGTMLINSVKEQTLEWNDIEMPDLFKQQSLPLQDLFKKPASNQEKPAIMEAVSHEKLFDQFHDTVTRKRLSNIMSAIPDVANDQNENIFAWPVNRTASTSDSLAMIHDKRNHIEEYPDDIDFLEPLDPSQNQGSNQMAETEDSDKNKPLNIQELGSYLEVKGSGIQVDSAIKNNCSITNEIGHISEIPNGGHLEISTAEKLDTTDYNDESFVVPRKLKSNLATTKNYRDLEQSPSAHASLSKTSLDLSHRQLESLEQAIPKNSDLARVKM